MPTPPPPAEFRAPTWQPGRSGNPAGRAKGEVYISEAVRMLLRGNRPTSSAPVWDVAANVVRSLRESKLDSRLLGIVLDRVEGKVPERIEASITAGVVVVPVARLELDSWERLAGAALAPAGGEPIEAEVISSTVAALRERRAAEDEEDEELEGPLEP